MNPILSFAEGERGSGLKFGSALWFRARWWLFFPKVLSTKHQAPEGSGAIPNPHFCHSWPSSAGDESLSSSLSSMVWARTFAMTRLGKYEDWGEVTRWASVCKNERKLGSAEDFLETTAMAPKLPLHSPHPHPDTHGTDSAPHRLISRPTARLLLQFP